MHSRTRSRFGLAVGVLSALAVLASACAADDPDGMFAAARTVSSDTVVNETENLDVDLDAVQQAQDAEDAPAESAAADSADSADDTEPSGTDPAPAIEIPDDALDLTGMAQVGIDIVDNAFAQRVVVVTAGTEITWTNQGRNEHNVRPAIPDAFEGISSLDLAQKGDAVSRAFADPGDFPYFCSIHGTPRNGQTGRIIVVPAA